MDASTETLAKNLKHGQPVKIWTARGDEDGTVMKRCPKSWGDVPTDEWTRVRYADGGVMTVHQTWLKVA